MQIPIANCNCGFLWQQVTLYYWIGLIAKRTTWAL